MTDQNWKRWERQVADDWGGKRIPINGREQIDIDHPTLSIECKFRKTIPDWLKKGLRQAQNKDGKLPILAVREKGGFDFVVMMKKDYEEWFNPKAGKVQCDNCGGRE